MADYTDDQKAEALRLYETEGPGEASRRTSIPRSTISRWASASGLNGPRQNRARAASDAAQVAWEQRRAVVRDRLGKEIVALLDRLAGATDRDAPRVMTAVGIAIDKAELLAGRATGRFEHGPTDPLDAELEQLLAEEAARRAGAANGKP